MKYFTHLITRLVFLALFCMIFSQKVYAYLDPGTGSYIFQVIMALLIGSIFTVKIYWGKIKLFIANLFTKLKKDDRG